MKLRYTAKLNGPATVYDKIWLPTTIPDTCIEYAGAPNEYGYCRTIDQRTGKLVRVHRVAYCKYNNIKLEDIAGKLLMHSCDNRRCINPKHLTLGTDLANSHDMIAKGRAFHNVGELCGASKLTEDKVRAIRAEKGSYLDIAVKYNIAKSTVAQIVNRITWKNVV